MKVLVFGKSSEDPVLPLLRKRFPSIGFKKHEMNEEIEEEGRSIIVLERVYGIDHVMIIEDLESISPAKAMKGSEHIMTLRILKSIGAIDSVKLIAIPEGYPTQEAVDEISVLLKGLQPIEE